MAKTKVTPAVVPGTSAKVKFRRYAAYVFRVLVVIILIRGVFSFFDKDAIVIQGEETPAVATPAAMSFAEAFAEAYYTIERGQNEQHRAAIMPFVGQALLGDSAGMRLNQIYDSYRVIDTLTWDIKIHSPDQADITVRTKIEASDESVFYRYLAVPVAHTGQGFYVNDFPYVVPQPVRINGDIASFPSRPGVMREIEDEIRTATADFFQSYASAPASQLRYYMYENQEIHGYNGELSYERLQDVLVYDGTEETENAASGPTDEVLVYASVDWKDAEGFAMTNHYTIRFVYSGDRWLIKQFQGGFKS